MIFLFVFWVHLIEIESVLITYGKEQEAIFIQNVNSGEFVNVRIQIVIVISWTKIVSERRLVKGKL